MPLQPKNRMVSSSATVHQKLTTAVRPILILTLRHHLESTTSTFSILSSFVHLRHNSCET